MKKTVAFFAILSLFLGCEESDQIGMDLIQSPAHMFATDTLTLRAMTVPDDSVATSIGTSKVLGLIDDPVFGISRASIYTETTLLANNLQLGDNLQLDSMHLVLDYQGTHYGVITTLQQIKVYELSENIPSDTLFSNSTIPHYPNIINLHGIGLTTSLNPTDSVLVDTIPQAPKLRIPLSNSFGQRFIDANSDTENEPFLNIPNYLEFFKGFLITPGDELENVEKASNSEAKGSMVRINMPIPTTTLELFYRAGQDTLMMVFPIEELERSFTAVEHLGYEHAHEALRAQVIDQDQSMGDSLLFVNSLGLLRADIDIPYFDAMVDESWLINKAELIVPVQEGFACENFPEPPQMLLMRKIPDHGLSMVADFALGIDYYGGLFDSTKQQYVFNITQYVQQLTDGIFDNDGLALINARNHDTPGRVVLHGPGRKENPMRLVIYYSVFE